jgi:outer membrane protein assembly factor BamB
MKTALLVAAVAMAAAAAVYAAGPETPASAAAPTTSDNWPQFRGPTGMGAATDKDLPTEWGGADNKNVLWKAPLKGFGQSSPIVWGDSVIVCTVFWPDNVPQNERGNRQPEQHVACYQTADGKLLWDTLVPPGPNKMNDFRGGPSGGYACPTPATDGKLIYVFFGSAVVAAVDFQGKVVWRKEVVPHTFDVTPAASPVIYKDTVLLWCSMAKKADSRVIAYDKATGETKWTTPLPNTDFGHSTPLLFEVGGKMQLVGTGSGMQTTDSAAVSLDPDSGKILWWCKGMSDIASPVFGNGLVYFDGGRGGNGTLVDPAGTGNVSATHIKATINVGGQAFGSPLVIGKNIYRLENDGLLKCWDMTTGAKVAEKKLDGMGTWWGSPIVDGQGRIYVATAGKSYVVQVGQGQEMKVLGTGDLGDPNHTSAAVSKGRLFLVGLKNIYCVGKAK